MKPHELGAVLREFEFANQARRKTLWRHVQRAATQPWFDAEWRAKLDALASEHGFALQTSGAAALGVGETWLLLFDSARARGLTGRIRFGAARTPDEHFGPRSRHAVQTAFVALCGWTGSNLRRLPAHVDAKQFDVLLPEAHGVIEGSSLGLSSAIALTSLALGKPAPTDVAASAALCPDGSLQPVAHLEEKLAALARSQPQVSRVFVARGQPRDHLPQSITLCDCSTLAEALSHLGLDVGALAPASLECFESRLEQLVRVEGVKTQTPERWIELAGEACEVGKALQTDVPDSAAEAFGHGALFALHAGHRELAETCHRLALNVTKEPSPAVVAWLSVVDASRLIDQATEQPAAASFQQAIDLASDGLARAQQLSGSDQDRVLGQALGTLGRAYLHAGEPARAIAYLERGVAHHRRADPKQVARSVTYLAAALRHAGRAEEATSQIRTALVALEGPQRWAMLETTRLYAKLELGRCLLASGKAREALTHFHDVVRGQRSDEQHPRISALRGIAAAYRQLGDAGNVTPVRDRCARVACGQHERLVRLLGAMAIGDALVAGDLEDASARTVWLALTGASDPAVTNSIVEQWVY